MARRPPTRGHPFTLRPPVSLHSGASRAATTLIPLLFLTLFGCHNSVDVIDEKISQFYARWVVFGSSVSRSSRATRARADVFRASTFGQQASAITTTSNPELKSVAMPV